MPNDSTINLYAQGSIDLNDQDWTRKAVLGNPGNGVYGSGSDCGVYAVVGSEQTSGNEAYGLKALKGFGVGAIFSQGDVHLTAGKVGINTRQPVEQLDVNGPIKVGGREDQGAGPGTIRWNAPISKLQVFDGNQWVNLH